MSDNADKRSVTTDALETLGQIIDKHQKRDAIHLAVEPVLAAQELKPGQDVGFVSPGCAGVVDHPLGIVDPFLTAPVQAGERFWLVVYPRQIKSLRHVWTHPAFPDTPEVAELVPALPEPPKEEPIKHTPQLWLELFASETGLDYNELLEAANGYLDHDEYLIDGGRWEGQHVPDKFWDHFQTVTGRAVPDSKRGSFFSCSC